VLWDIDRADPALLTHGMTVQFRVGAPRGVGAPPARGGGS
jgi:allophanate hydrolase subunit 1